MRIFLVALPFLAVSACATPETRVRTALIQSGVRPGVASCMADEMTKRLSISQLQELKRARGLPGEKVTDLTAREFLERARRIGDPQVVGVTTAAAGLCSLLN